MLEAISCNQSMYKQQQIDVRGLLITPIMDTGYMQAIFSHSLQIFHETPMTTTS